MSVSDLKANTGKVELEGTISKKEETRTFEKFGKSGKVANAILSDDTGSVKLTLWGDDADKVKEGDKVKVSNGWCGEWQGTLQVSAGKFGKIEKL